MIVLSKVSQRDDCAAIVPQRMDKAAAMKVGASLVARKLVREIRSKAGMPVWREDADGRPFSLILTRAGRDAIGVEESPGGRAPPARAKASPATPAPAPAKSVQTDDPRDGSKQALVVSMLSKAEGATLDAPIGATGWLPMVFRRLEELAPICDARHGSLGAFIEDKNSGTVLLQHANRRQMRVHAIESKLTAMGKDERAIAASPYVYRGFVKYSDHAFNKLMIYKQKARNHLLDQIESV